MKILKNKIFIKSIVYDVLGMATVAIPVVGPFLDIIWAPYAAKQMSEMYPGRNGKIASVFVFIEEILAIYRCDPDLHPDVAVHLCLEKREGAKRPNYRSRELLNLYFN